MPHALSEVLDQYLGPAQVPSVRALGESRILVPALPGDSTVARLALALARRLRASALSCAVRGLDTRARALCDEGVAPPHPTPDVALCLAAAPAGDFSATLLFLLPGWEFRAELLRRARPEAGAPLWVVEGESEGGLATVPWRLAPFGLVPATVDAWPGSLATALRPAAARPDSGLDRVALRLRALALRGAVSRVAVPLWHFPCRETLRSDFSRHSEPVSVHTTRRG
jgi:hypothetical protein